MMSDDQLEFKNLSEPTKELVRKLVIANSAKNDVIEMSDRGKANFVSHLIQLAIITEELLACRYCPPEDETYG